MQAFEQMSIPHPEAHVAMTTVSYTGRGCYTVSVRVWCPLCRTVVEKAEYDRLTLDEAVDVMCAVAATTWPGVSS